MKIQEGIFVTDTNIVQYAKERGHARDQCAALAWFVDIVKELFLYDAGMLDRGKRGVFIAFAVFMLDEINLCVLKSQMYYFRNKTLFEVCFPALPYEENYVRVVE